MPDLTDLLLERDRQWRSLVDDLLRLLLGRPGPDRSKTIECAKAALRAPAPRRPGFGGGGELCTVCGRNPVDSAAGFDTCSACQNGV